MWTHAATCANSEALQSSQTAHFIEKLRKSQHASACSPEVPYLQEDATFGDLLEKLCERKVHRLYTVDSECRPVGVTTLTDILFAISGEASK
jgi:predicted transcriptional regulator